MGKYQIKIELLSDLCVSDGGVYNSSLDTDICYDAYGFPFIPAKRLKGCLRECAQELQDWDINWSDKDFSIKRFFGSEGKQPSKVRIGNARLENYDKMRAEAEKYKNSLIFHPQNILQHFSYIRTQTAINPETGVADDTSLRTMRVADKGLVFIAETEMEEKYYKDFTNIISVFSSMGIARTRGFGEIKASLVPIKTGFCQNNAIVNNTEENVCGAETLCRLEYSIYLEEPVICKSMDGGETKSMDYIEGSKMLGIIAQEYAKEHYGSFTEFLDKGKLVFANAYPEKEGCRFTEVPASWYGIKNNDKYFINKIYKETDKGNKLVTGQQLNAMKHCYVNAGVYSKENPVTIKYDVKLEERYHHRRPDDKSYGHVVESAGGNSQMYQMSSIMEGQSFRGYILGSMGQLIEIERYLSKKKEYYIGYSHSAEYGKVRIQTGNKKEETGQHKDTQNTKFKDLVVKLEAPVIVYNKDSVMYSTMAEDLLEEVTTALGIKGAEIGKIDKFINYTSIGGYNVTWGRRKPVLDAFDKGTVLVLHLKEPASLSVPVSVDAPVTVFLGERIIEGYGETSVYPLRQGENRYIGEFADEENNGSTECVDISQTVIGKEISMKLFREHLNVLAINDASDKKNEDSNVYKPAIRALMLICKEQKNMADIKETVTKRFSKNSIVKNKKLEVAKNILEKVNGINQEIVKDFEEKYGIINFECDTEKSKLFYLEAYLTELKYIFHQKDKKGEGYYCE